MYERLNNLIDYKKLENKNILIVGVGGVGSSCFEVLIRSGIKNITIIDNDTYEKSNLNRQLCSNENVIGLNKVDILKKHAEEINKDINVNNICAFVDNSFNMDFKKYDYIIDACDSIEAKCYLIEKAHEENIPIICSMGVGKRINPSDLEVTMLDKVIGDPLAKKLKKSLKNDKIKVTVVASREIPIKDKVICSYVGVSMYAGILLADKILKDLLK